MKKLCILLFSVILWSSCESLPDDENGLREIMLSTTIGEVEVQSRGEGPIKQENITVTTDKEISLMRLDEVAGAYPENYSTINSTYIKDAVIAKEGDTLVARFGSPEYYVGEGVKTKIFGWYPRTAPADWSTTGGRGFISFGELDGSTDVMASNPLEGSNLNPITNTNQLEFNHVLTQLIVQVKSTHPGLWGGLQHIAIKDKKQTCTLEAGMPRTIDGMTVSFGAPAGDLDLVKAYPATGNAIKAAGDDVYGSDNPLALSSTEQVCGYAMFAPTEVKSLPISVTTETGGERIIDVLALNREGVTEMQAGKAYTVTLSFQGTTIEPTIEVAPWNVIVKEIDL